MASYGVFQDVQPGTTVSIGGTVQVQSPAAISQVNTSLVGGTFLESVQVIAANSTGTQASGTPVISTGLVQATSGGAAYSVTLPPSVPGMAITILTTTATNTVAVFPAVGEAINALGANTKITMAALSSTTFNCVVAGQWWTSPKVPS